MNRHRGIARVILLLLAAFLILALLAASVPALAQPRGLTLSTSYPGISANPGERITFSVKIKDTSGVTQLVNLEVAEAPAGWEAVLKGRGRAIHQVLVAGGETEFFELDVRIPAEAQSGSYRFVIRAKGREGDVTLPLEVRVQVGAASGVKLVTDYPVLQGPSGAVFEFRLNLANDTPNEQMFSLGAQAPPGWEVTFQPSYENKQIASLSLEAGKTQGLNVRVRPPRLVKAGEYPIEVQAVSARASVGSQVRVVITGSYELKLSTPSGRLNASVLAGRENPVAIVVENTGTAPLQNVRFSASAPRNWSVTFEPEQLDDLAVGESREVKALVRPDARAIAGDYVVGMRANAGQAYNEAEFRVTVRTPTTWGIVGIGIVVAVIAGLATVFRAYGRR